MRKYLVLLTLPITLLAQDPTPPPAPSSGSSTNHKAAYSAYEYFLAQTTNLRAEVERLKTLLEGQPPSSVDLAPVLDAIKVVELDVKRLNSVVPQPVNLRILSINGRDVQLDWDFEVPPDNVSQIRIQRSIADGSTWGDTAVTDDINGPYTDRPVTTGDYLYRVYAVAKSYVFAKDSLVSNETTAVIPPVVN